MDLEARFPHLNYLVRCPRRAHTLSTTGGRYIQAGASRCSRVFGILPTFFHLYLFISHWNAFLSSYIWKIVPLRCLPLKAPTETLLSLNVHTVLFKYVYMWVHLLVHMCITHMLTETRRGCWTFWNWRQAYRRLHMWILGPTPSLQQKRESAFNCYGTSTAHIQIFRLFPPWRKLTVTDKVILWFQFYPCEFFFGVYRG